MKKIRFFLDTEFNEHARRFALDPISIALVPEDRTRADFYAVSNEFSREGLTPWLKENVVRHLPPEGERLSNDAIRDKLAAYMASFGPADVIEIWALNGATDNVVLAQFFGGLLPLRDAFSKAGQPRVEFREIKELLRATGEKKPAPPAKAHDCLADALWTRDLFEALTPKLGRTKRFLID